MDGEFRVPGGKGEDQTYHIIDSNLDLLANEVRKLVTENKKLERLRNMLTIHAQQFEHDMERLKYMQKRMKAQLENVSLPRIVQETKSKDVETKPVTDAGDPSLLALVDTDWDVLPLSTAVSPQSVTLRYSLNIDSVLCTIRFNSDGTLFAFADGRTVFIINAEDGSLVGTCEIERVSDKDPHTRAIAFSPDSTKLALSGPDNKVILIDVATRKVIMSLSKHTHFVSSLAFLSDSDLISGGFDGQLCIWDLNTMTCKKSITHGDSTGQKTDEANMIVSIAVSKDDDLVAVGFMSGQVGIYEASFSQPMTTFGAHSEYLLGVAVSPTGLIGTASHDKTAKLWLVRGIASCKQKLVRHEDLVLTVTFNPDGSKVFTGSKDEKIMCWNSATGECLFALTGHKNTVFQIDHHPYNKTFVSCSGEGLICVWDYTC